MAPPVGGRKYVPDYSGKGRLTRVVNRARRALPGLTHFVEAIAGLKLREHRTGLTWRAVLRVPAHAAPNVVVAATLAEALPRLVEMREPGYARVGGLAYEITPTSPSFVGVEHHLLRRAYGSYEDYIRHQASKLEKEEAFVRNSSEQRYRKMARRFTEIAGRAQLSGRVICLGARLGEEVRAFRDAGLKAVGVDLNPGPGNRDCLYADFHHLPFLDNSFDGAYSNVLDHVFDMDRFMREVVRVVRPGGFVYFELTGGFTETGAVDRYGATLWTTNAVLVEALTPYSSETLLDLDDAKRARRVVVLKSSKRVLQSR